MKKYILFITSSPQKTLNSQLARSFCKTAVNQGFKVEQIFFYQDAVFHASTEHSVTTQQSELHKWIDLAKQTSIPLKLCITAAEKRGLITYQANEKISFIHPLFDCCGMAEYFATLQNVQSTDIVSLQF